MRGNQIASRWGIPQNGIHEIRWKNNVRDQQLLNPQIVYTTSPVAVSVVVAAAAAVDVILFVNGDVSSLSSNWRLFSFSVVAVLRGSVVVFSLWMGQWFRTCECATLDTGSRSSSQESLRRPKMGKNKTQSILLLFIFLLFLNTVSGEQVGISPHRLLRNYLWCTEIIFIIHINLGNPKLQIGQNGVSVLSFNSNFLTTQINHTISTYSTLSRNNSTINLSEFGQWNIHRWSVND